MALLSGGPGRVLGWTGWVLVRDLGVEVEVLMESKGESIMRGIAFRGSVFCVNSYKTAKFQIMEMEYREYRLKL